MTEAQRIIAVRILREQIAVRQKENDLIRKRFGDRITIALTAECKFRDGEIEALDATLEEIAEVPSLM